MYIDKEKLYNDLLELTGRAFYTIAHKDDSGFNPDDWVNEYLGRQYEYEPNRVYHNLFSQQVKCHVSAILCLLDEHVKKERISTPFGLVD